MKFFPRYGFFIGLLLLSHSLLAQYSGGNGGGHAMAALIQYDDAPVANNPQVLYKGGYGGGHAFAELILDTTTVVPNNPQRLYVGGVGGGHSFSALLLDTSEVVLQNPQRLYTGGIGGGHAFGLFLLDTVEVVIQNPQKLYLGGIGGGYALAQTYQDTNMVVPQNPQLLYRGGIGGGHDLDTSTQSLVVKDCISPPKPSAQSVALCAGAVFNGIQVPELTGHFIRWYSSANGGTATLTPPAVSTSTPGVFRIYATYVNDSSTCESGRTAMEITIQSRPASPVVASSSLCVGTTAPVLNASALPGHTLQWYKDSSIVNLLPSMPLVETQTAGTFSFFVRQRNDVSGCISDVSRINMLVNNKPEVPQASPINLCQSTGSVTLTATTSAGHILRWFADSISTNPLTAAPIVSLQSPDSLSYYISQQNLTTGCISERARVPVVVKLNPLKPVADTLKICQGGLPVELNALALSGHKLRWYQDTTSTNALPSTPKLPTQTAGNFIYYVSQTDTISGCESKRSAIVTTVLSKPAMPITVPSVAYCIGANAIGLSATASANHSLRWYTDSTGGNPSNAPLVPTTVNAGMTNYYVSQINTPTGCESERTPIVVTVNSTQSPVVAAVSWCQQSASTALTATAASGHRLNWYGNSATGGSGSNTAPVPSTSVTGTFDFYVSQTNLASGCESMRSKLTVTIYQTPEKPVVTRDANANLVSSVKTGLQWLKDQFVINGAVDSIFKPSVSGNYSVRHTQNGCTVFSQDYYYMTTALVNLNNDEYIEIFPNPFQSYLQINFKLNRLNKPNLKVYEASGKLIYEETQVMPGVKLNTSGWINGSYRIVISTETSLILYTGSVVK